MIYTKSGDANTRTHQTPVAKVASVASVVPRAHLGVGLGQQELALEQGEVARDRAELHLPPRALEQVQHRLRVQLHVRHVLETHLRPRVAWLRSRNSYALCDSATVEYPQ